MAQHPYTPPPLLTQVQFNVDSVLILGLDIAKHKTGYCILKYTPERISLVTAGIIKTPTNNNRWLFQAKEIISNSLRSLLQTYMIEKDSKLLAVVEHSVSGMSQSEQQTVLFQEALHILKHSAIDTLAIPPTVLKYFIKSFSTQPAPANLKKPDILTIYSRDLVPQNTWLKPPEALASDDELDATFLAMMGALVKGKDTFYVDYDYLNGQVDEGRYTLPQVFADTAVRECIGVIPNKQPPVTFVTAPNFIDINGNPFKATCLAPTFKKSTFPQFSSRFNYPFSKVAFLNSLLRASEGHPHLQTFFCQQHKISSTQLELFNSRRGGFFILNNEGFYIFSPITHKFG